MNAPIAPELGAAIPRPIHDRLFRSRVASSAAAYDAAGGGVRGGLGELGAFTARQRWIITQLAKRYGVDRAVAMVRAGDTEGLSGLGARKKKKRRGKKKGRRGARRGRRFTPKQRGAITRLAKRVGPARAASIVRARFNAPLTESNAAPHAGFAPIPTAAGPKRRKKRRSFGRFLQRADSRIAEAAESSTGSALMNFMPTEPAIPSDGQIDPSTGYTQSPFDATNASDVYQDSGDYSDDGSGGWDEEAAQDDEPATSEDYEDGATDQDEVDALEDAGLDQDQAIEGLGFFGKKMRKKLKKLGKGLLKTAFPQTAGIFDQFGKKKKKGGGGPAAIMPAGPAPRAKAGGFKIDPKLLMIGGGALLLIVAMKGGRK